MASWAFCQHDTLPRWIVFTVLPPTATLTIFQPSFNLSAMESPQLPIRFSGGRGARVESPTKIKFPADAAIAAKTAPAAITMRVPFILRFPFNS